MIRHGGLDFVGEVVFALPVQFTVMLEIGIEIVFDRALRAPSAITKMSSVMLAATRQ